MAFNGIIRKFYPIGQGAFYSEQIYDGDRRFNIVYDCGVDCVRDYHKSIVLDAFSKQDTINYLFISHLDKDHISLIKTLRDSVERIENVVLPLIDDRNIKILYFLSQMSDDSDVSSFWSTVRNAVANQMTDNDAPRFFFIVSEGSGFEPRETPSFEYRSSGKVVHAQSLRNLDFLWEIIPFCQHSERITELDEKLKDLLDDSEFCANLMDLKMQCDSLDDLKQLLSTDAISDLIGNRVICKKLHEAYSSISGSINQNSLLVYSGPDDAYDEQLAIESYFPFRHTLFYHYLSEMRIGHRAACIYTGDSDLDMFYYKNHLASLWENVGTIQLPHHGSHNSFKISYNKYKFDRSYLFPVSFGEKNNHHHPSGKVLSFLLGAGCLPVPVTDDFNTLFTQVITEKANVNS